MSTKGKLRREAIVAAAAGLFWSEGYAATSLGTVAAAAQVPTGNMFYYFRSKADLAMAVADIFMEETCALIEEAGRAAPDPEHRVRFLIQRLAQSNRNRVEKGCPISLAVRDFRLPAPEASARAAQSFERLIGFMAQEFQRAGLKPSPAFAQARSLMIEWQGGIALAHALSDMSVLAESFRRIEQLLRRSFA